MSDGVKQVVFTGPVSRYSCVHLPLSLVKRGSRLVLVAHACNPSYSGSRDQEAHGLEPAWANSSGDPISKSPLQKKKKGLVE
jgi:hypothetical protein